MLVRFAVQAKMLANIEFELECILRFECRNCFLQQINGHLHMLVRQKSCQSKRDQHVGLICWTTCWPMCLFEEGGGRLIEALRYKDEKQRILYRFKYSHSNSTIFSVRY